MYGRAFADLGLGERRLFPGALPFMLAIVALLWRPPARTLVVWAVALAVAFEMSLGVRGYSYPFLYEHVPVFEALRSPARMGIFVVMCLAVLAGHGFASLHAGLPAAARWLLPALITGILLLEYRVTPLQLAPYANSAPPVYSLLAALPPGIVAEFPMPQANHLPGQEAFYTYMSTFHWRPLVNGYSGFYPSRYLHRLRALRGFPDAHSIAVLREEGVNYVIVHLSLYELSKRVPLTEALEQRSELRYVGHDKDGIDIALVYGLEPVQSGEPPAPTDLP
jgi:hypothetical protein